MKTHSRLLISESPMNVLPSLAEKIGIEHAIVLQQIQYWLTTHEGKHNSRTFRNDRWWVYNTLQEWQCKQFRWWSVETIKRILQSLEKMGLVITERFEQASWNQRKWYSIDYDAVEKLEKLEIEGWKLSRATLIETIADAVKTSSNPHGCALGQIDPISECNLTPLEGAICPDDLYTETTNRDYESETTLNQCTKAKDELLPISHEKEESIDFFEPEPETEPIEPQPTSSAQNSPRQKNASTKTDKSRSRQQTPRNSLKKEKAIKFVRDEYGLYQIPRSPQYRLPALLTTRTLQFLIAHRYLDCEFGKDDRGVVWVADPREGNAVTEEIAFGKGEDGERGRLPLKKLLAVCMNPPSGKGCLDCEWYNDQVSYFFVEWRKWCDRLGDRAMYHLQHESVAQIVKDLVPFSPYFFHEFIDAG